MGLLRRLLGKSSSPTAASTVPVPEFEFETRRSRLALDEFYEMHERLERAQRARDGDLVLGLCDEAVGMLPAFIDAWRDEELESRRVLGEATRLEGDWFQISSIRCVDLTCRWAAVRGDRDRLENLRAKLAERPELARWVGDVDRAVANLEASMTLLAAIETQPGVRQAGLAGRLGLDGRTSATLLSWLEEDGRVARRKEAGTYALFPAATPSPLVALVERAAERPAASKPKPVLARPDPPTRDQLQALSGVRFAAIDFETATSARGSACALGVCVIDDCRPVAAQRFLIRPPDNRYDPFNTMLHGIGPTDTARSPELPAVWAQAQAIIGDLPIVAHNAAFDVGVLRDGLLAANVPWPTLDIYCTLVLSRRAWPGLLSYGLVMLVDFCGLQLDNHHDPLADASACAGLALAICATTGTDSLSTATARLGVHAGQLDRALWDSCRANYLAGRNLARIRLEANADADPNHPLYGRTVVFTGTLDSMTRAQARLCAANVGAHATTSVSHLTNYLVAGQADYSKFTDGQHSHKTLRAEELLAEGYPIEVISEADFLHLLLSGE